MEGFLFPGYTVQRATKKDSAAGTRTRVSWVRAKYPNQLDYGGQLITVAAEEPLLLSISLRVQKWDL